MTKRLTLKELTEQWGGDVWAIRPTPPDAVKIAVEAINDYRHIVDQGMSHGDALIIVKTRIRCALNDKPVKSALAPVKS